MPAGDHRAHREGPFWDVVEGRRTPPPAAVLLGFRLVSVDPEAGTIEVAFDAGEKFLNPAGQVQGGSRSWPATSPARGGEIVASATATAVIRRRAL